MYFFNKNTPSKSLISNLTARIGEPAYTCPPASELPTDHPELPWSHSMMVRFYNGLYHLEKEKSRPKSDLQFWGDRQSFRIAEFDPRNNRAVA